VGHIFFIAPNDKCNLDALAQWTLRWMLQHDLPADTAIYSCTRLDQALRSLEEPLAAGEPPALIVFDHGDPPTPETIRFCERLHSCIPEAWIVELVSSKMPLPKNPGDSFWVKKPVCQEDWVDVLQHVFLQAATPQWSNADSSKR